MRYLGKGWFFPEDKGERSKEKARTELLESCSGERGSAVKWYLDTPLLSNTQDGAA
jgi:hypothetical protein